MHPCPVLAWVGFDGDGFMWGVLCVCVCARRCSWDPYLDKEEFTVGYLDRFVGLKEKPFSQFVWYVCSRRQALAADSA